MPLIRPFRQVPQNLAEWERFFRDVTVADDDITEPKIADNSVTDAKIRDSAALSVIGRSASTSGNPGDISATVADTFLTRRGSALTWDVLTDGDIPATIARDSEVTAAVAAEATARTAAIDAEFLSGSFTGTLTGVAGTITGTLRYETARGICALYVPALSDTSNATTMTITGAPAAIFPTRQQVTPYVVTENGTVQLGLVTVETSGVLTFSADVTGAAFTATGSKGVALQTITYALT